MNVKYLKSLLAFALVVSICIGPDTLAKSEEFQNQLPLDKGEVFLAPLQPTQDKENIPEGPEYARGELIVKFTESAGAEIDGNISVLTMEVAPAQTGITSINQLNIEYGVAKIEPVLKQRKKKQLLTDKTDRQMFQETQERFPQRAARAPKGIQPPNLSNIYLLKLQDQDADIYSVCGAYENDTNVIYAEPNYIRRSYLKPSDYYFDTSGAWGQTYKDMWGLHRIDMARAWSMTTGSNQIIVAVSDSGVDYNHPDIAANMWTDSQGYHGYDHVNNDNYPMDDMGHGTHCAGTIAACSNNGIGVAGVSWNARIMAVKGLNQNGMGYDYVLADGIDYAVQNGADIINMSWGGEGRSAVLSDSLQTAYASGVVLVAAAGNDDANVSMYCPASSPYVISVAAWSYDNDRAWFSNWGDLIDVTAPGVEILSLRAADTDMYLGAYGYTPGERFVPPFDPEAEYYRSRGTSMAAPHVCGLAALILSFEQSLSPGLVETIIEESTEDVLETGKDVGSGHGLIDARQALVLTQNVIRNSLPELYIFSASAYLTADQVEIRAEIENIGLLSASNIVYQIYYGKPSEGGMLVYEDTISTLAPNEKYSLAEDLPYDNLPSVVTIVVDPGDLIDECFETNNQQTFEPSVIYPGWPKYADHLISTSPALADLDGDGNLEIVIGTWNGTVYAWNANGTLVSGWPQDAADFVFAASMAIADLDPDYPGLEVICGSGVFKSGDNDGRVYVWHADGTPVDGWPKDTAGVVFSAPAVADIDGDGGLEIVVGTEHGTHGYVYVWHADGTVLPWWPCFTNGAAKSSPALADLDGDGDLEIIIGSHDGRVYAWHHDNKDGDNLADDVDGWPRFAYGQVESSPAIGDLDNDGDLEIVVGCGYHYDDGAVYAWHHDDKDGDGLADLVNGWPQNLEEGSIDGDVNSSPALADIDGDGDLEIVAASDGPTGRYAHVWHHDDKDGDGLADKVSGWPIRITGPPNSPALADIDGDGGLEIVLTTSFNYLYAWHTDGTPLDFWPLQSKNVWAFETSPSIADLDGDGTLEIAVTGLSELYVFRSPWFSSPRMPWPMFRHDLRHTGKYNFPPELEPISNKTFYVGKHGGFEVIASDAEDDAVEFKCFSLPQGAGLLQWNKTDINKDGIIDDEDVTIFNLAYNTAEGNPSYDIVCDFNEDGRINLTDFSVLGEMHGQILKESPRFNTASFGWRPFSNQAGTHNIRFMASDNLNYDTTTVKITVLNQSGKPREPKNPKQDPKELR